MHRRLSQPLAMTVTKRTAALEQRQQTPPPHLFRRRIPLGTVSTSRPPWIETQSQVVVRLYGEDDEYMKDNDDEGRRGRFLGKEDAPLVH